MRAVVTGSLVLTLRALAIDFSYFSEQDFITLGEAEVETTVLSSFVFLALFLNDLSAFLALLAVKSLEFWSTRKP